MKKEQRLLAEMASVGRMCRGKVSVRRQGKSGGEYFVLQCWHGGANRCRYVHPARRKAYEEACEGYRRFMSLAESYADIVIARTEKEIAKIKVEDGRTKKARAARYNVERTLFQAAKRLCSLTTGYRWLRLANMPTSALAS